MELVLGLLNQLFQQLEVIPVSAAVAVLVLVAAVPLMSDRGFALVQFSLFLLPLTQYAPAGSSNGIRGVTIVLAAVRMVATHRLGTRQLLYGLGGWARFLVVSAVLVVLSSIWSLSPFESLSAGIGLISTIAVLWSTSPDGRTARWAAERMIGAVVVASVLVMPLADAWAGGRLRGVMVNANGLAVFLAMAALLSLGARRVPALQFLGCTVLLFLTGSRSGALALSCGLVVLAITQWRRRNVTPRGLAVVVATSAALAFVMLTIPFDRLPWRTKDTRSAVWERSFGLVQEHMLLGLGGGAFPSESGNSYLRVLGELGLVGSLVCVFALVTGLRLRALGPVQVALLGAMAVHMLFEGWFLVGGSAIFLFVIALTVPAPEHLVQREQVRPTPPRDRVRRGGVAPVRGVW